MNPGLHTAIAQSAPPTQAPPAPWTPAPGGLRLPAPPPGRPIPEIRPLTLCQPGKILFGDGCSSRLVEELTARGLRRSFVVTDPAAPAGTVLQQLRDAGIHAASYERIAGEPSVSVFQDCLAQARACSPDAVIGLGGGSAMDTAKLVAALVDSAQPVTETFGINALRGRRCFLACLPTTAGTGSEVSPNAILLDESERLKKGVISPHLVPDIALVDPVLTWSVPAPVTAATGLDALIHCIEAYANNFAHPIVDLYALEGIRLISGSLRAALRDGHNAPARAALALGSLYGGLCLGPVNTGAVHALAYPLGSRFHTPHGVSTAVLLPHVLRFNLTAAPERYAQIALALSGLSGTLDLPHQASQLAQQGIQLLEELIADCPIPHRLSELGIPQEILPELAASALTVTRLLKNNPRPLSSAEALEVYRVAW